jgi:hypothetical protein
VLLILGALALLAGGVAMLTAGTAATATRLGRFAGIAIIVALVLGYGAIRGRF